MLTTGDFRGVWERLYRPLVLVPLPQLFGYTLLVFLAYQIGSAIYNVTLHPLAKIPGPKLAGASKFYQTFWGTYQNKSEYYKRVAYLHQIYGPVVRITPGEVSLSDPEDYDKIYHIGSKYHKSQEYYSPFGVPTGIFTAVDNSLHAKRRAPLNPFFSRQKVISIQDTIREKIRTLCDRLDKEIAINGVAPLHHMYNALSLDVASGYLFNHSYDSLHQENYAIEFTKMVKVVLGAFWVMVQSSIFCAFIKGLPEFITDINPSLRGYHKLFRDMRVTVNQVVDEVSSGKTPSQRSSIFHTLLDPPTTDEYRKPKDYQPPSIEQLTDDGASFIVAAAVTTGNSMMVSSYHILRNKEIYLRLRKEILEHFPLKGSTTEMDFTSLERLPYLTGCIKEGLRLAYGPIGRLPRTIPEGGATFHGHHLPAGYNVGMSAWIMHRYPGIWPNPDRFDPERWTDPTEAKRLNKYLISFGKDSRNCIGMNLALCEIYLMIATLIRDYDDLEIYKMTDQDLEFDDRFGASQQTQCKPFQVYRSGKSVDFAVEQEQLN